MFWGAKSKERGSGNNRVYRNLNNSVEISFATKTFAHPFSKVLLTEASFKQHGRPQLSFLPSHCRKIKLQRFQLDRGSFFASMRCVCIAWGWGGKSVTAPIEGCIRSIALSLEESCCLYRWDGGLAFVMERILTHHFIQRFCQRRRAGAADGQGFDRVGGHHRESAWNT